jgi:hypothetical protein
MTKDCKHKFTIVIPVEEMKMVPPMVQRGGHDGVNDRKCEICGVVNRAWGSVWEKYDRDNTPKLCSTCSFYDEIAPAEHTAEGYDLGLCTIQKDRLPLWAKSCGCNTYVHGDWADCPTWTTGVKMVAEPDSPSETPRWLPLGEVFHGSHKLAEQFKAVLEFAQKHRNINADIDKAVTDASQHWVTDFDHEAEHSYLAFIDLMDALQAVCPPFCYFGGSEGDSSSIGVWVSDDAVHEAIQDRKMVKIVNWLDVHNVSPTWEWVLVVSKLSGAYERLYGSVDGVRQQVWNLPD